MLKKLILKNWKSYRHAELFIDPLTVLIGTNASGKSNALDGLEFLNRTALGKEIQAALLGNEILSAIRGGVEWAAFKPESQFTLEVLVQGSNERVDYFYSITVETKPRVQLLAESLVRITKRPKTDKNPHKISLFQTDISSPDSPSIVARLYNTKKGKPKEVRRSNSILSQLTGLASISQEITEGISIVSQVLQNIFILDPIPSKMRSYSPLSDHILSDASNIAGILAALEEPEKSQVETEITKYVTDLPERDIQKLWAEPVGKFNSDAMLYCQEMWVQNQKPTLIDARGMSDGTLRFLAILTTLLTRTENSQVVIEEVDNGLHPSRSELLIKMLREIGERRQIDILITTHNPALLDALGSEIVPFVVVAHRDSETGESKLTLLEDIENLPKLMASGTLGKITSQGSLEKSLSSVN
ncbi:AAA family ATPase [Chlorogloea sp. CCALA 695]|uniref:AAA family ATPase n=1 Tax=Chlorogloea sp. CCALA 695 TaxID=2107693 RepID=UPI000D0754FC|nr:ATP-binding protein [Chlorogloea sp. CCALA 695]PSB33326.1 ATPase [Chlorogloea sp. CCALA 695]